MLYHVEVTFDLNLLKLKKAHEVKILFDKLPSKEKFEFVKIIPFKLIMKVIKQAGREGKKLGKEVVKEIDRASRKGKKLDLSDVITKII